MVVIDLKQEVSNVSPQKIQGIDSPIIQKRTATTSAVVADRQTVLIGVLISEERSQVRTGIPWLSKIPILGYLFGATTDQVKKRELIILITPRVVGEPEDARGITSQFEERVKGLQEQLRQYRKEN
jgi:general secretion pathway protein D